MSSALQTFDDRTIKRAREKFTGGKRGSGDDPIATHSKVAQDVLLGHLERLISRAENKAYQTTAGLQGELDGESLIDPFISYDENVAKIQDEYGVEFESYARKKQEDREKDANEQSRKHARDWLTEKVEETAGGDPADLLRSAIDGETENEELAAAVDEIREEFDETLLTDVLSHLEGPDEPITAPEPKDAEKTPKPIETETVEPVESSADPDPEPVETADPETAAPADYSGILGTFRLVKDVIVANYHAGKRETANTTQTTLEAY